MLSAALDIKFRGGWKPTLVLEGFFEAEPGREPAGGDFLKDGTNGSLGWRLFWC